MNTIPPRAAIPLQNDQVRDMRAEIETQPRGPFTANLLALLDEVLSLRVALAVARGVPALSELDLKRAMGYTDYAERWHMRYEEGFGFRIHDENGLLIAELWGDAHRIPDAECVAAAPRLMCMLRQIALWSERVRDRDGKPGLPPAMHAAVYTILAGFQDPNVEREFVDWTAPERWPVREPGSSA